MVAGDKNTPEQRLKGRNLGGGATTPGSRGSTPSREDALIARVQNAQSTSPLWKESDSNPDSVRIGAAKRVFKAMDSDANGNLTHNEVKKYLKANGDMRRQLMPAGMAWKEVFDKMDNDPRDHAIKEDEFVKYFLEMTRPAQAKAPKKKLNSDEEARMQRSLQVTKIHMAVNVATNVLCITARPPLLLELVKGDTKYQAETLSMLAGGVGLTEYLLNPAIGRLSDAYGRKPFLLLGPLANLILKGNVALNPSVRAIIVERIVSGALTTMSGSTTCMAILSDLTSGKGLAISGAGLGSMAGIGCILGPFIGGQLIARTGNLRLPFFFAAVTGLLQTVMILTCFEETIVKRKAFEWAAVNPFSWLRLFTKSNALAKLVTIGGLQCFPEGKNLSDLNQLYILNHVGWSQETRSWFTVSFGGCMTFGGRFATKSLEYLGQRGHTTMSNWMTLIALSTWGIKPSGFNMWLGMLLLLPTMERRTAISSLATQEALKCGFERGEFTGLFANWRAVATAIAPVMYGKILSVMAKRGFPGAPYVVAGLICVLAEMIHKSMSNKEMGIGDDD